MDGGRQPLDLGQGGRPAARQVDGQIDQLGVPRFELPQVTRPIAPLAQQGVALGQHAAVLHLGAGVGGVGLRDRAIEETAALGRRALDDHQVIRLKKDGIPQPGQLGGASPDAVDQDFLLPPGLAFEAGRVRYQADLQALRMAGPTDLGHDAGEGARLMERQEIDQLAVTGSPRRFGGHQVLDPLQQAGFALGVRSHHQRRAGGKFHFETNEVAEIRQREVDEQHARGIVACQGYRASRNDAGTGTHRGRATVARRPLPTYKRRSGDQLVAAPAPPRERGETGRRLRLDERSPQGGTMNQSAVGIPTEMLGLEIRPLLRRVYLWMTVGVLLTAIMALLTVTTPVLRNLLLNPLVIWGALIGEFVLVIVLSAAIRRLSPMVAALMFFAYAGLLGFSLSAIFFVYDLGSIALAFLSASALFGMMTFVGFATRADLTKLGTYLIVGLFW